jgi:hypothetical protein
MHHYTEGPFLYPHRYMLLSVESPLGCGPRVLNLGPTVLCRCSSCFLLRTSHPQIAAQYETEGGATRKTLPSNIGKMSSNC